MRNVRWDKFSLYRYFNVINEMHKVSLPYCKKFSFTWISKVTAIFAVSAPVSRVPRNLTIQMTAIVCTIVFIFILNWFYFSYTIHWYFYFLFNLLSNNPCNHLLLSFRFFMINSIKGDFEPILPKERFWCIFQLQEHFLIKQLSFIQLALVISVGQRKRKPQIRFKYSNWVFICSSCVVFYQTCVIKMKYIEKFIAN